MSINTRPGLETEPPVESKLQRAGWYTAFGLIPFGDSIIALLILLIDRVHRLFRRRKESPQPMCAPPLARWANRLILALLFSVLLSSTFSPRPAVAFVFDIGFYLAIFALFYGAVNLGRLAPDQLRHRYLPVMIFATMAACIIALIRYGVIHYIQHDLEYRAANLLSGRNTLGTTMIYVGGLGFTYLVARGGKWRRLIIPFLGLVCATLLMTRSRGAWFGFAGMLGTLCLFGRRYLAVLIAATLVISLFFVSSPMLRDRFQESFTAGGDAGRLMIWQSTFTMIRDNPIVGVGTGVYPFVFNQYAVESIKEWPIAYAHNIFLQVCAEFGLIGLAIFSALLATILLMSLALARTGDPVYQGIFAVLIGILIHQQLDCTIWGIGFGGAFWMLLGLVTGLYTHERTRGSLVKTCLNRGTPRAATPTN